MSNNNVGMYVLSKINKYKTGNYSGELANLRRGFGKPVTESGQIATQGVISGMPENMRGRNYNMSKEEYAAYIALTSFAAHQQSHSITSDLMHEKQCTFGKAMSKIVDGDELSNSMQSRSGDLCRLTESKDISEFAMRLCPIVRMFNQKGVKLDYYDFANDIMHFQFKGGAFEVALKWFRDLDRGMNEKRRNNNTDLDYTCVA